MFLYVQVHRRNKLFLSVCHIIFCLSNYQSLSKYVNIYRSPQPRKPEEIDIEPRQVPTLVCKMHKKRCWMSKLLIELRRTILFVENAKIWIPCLWCANPSFCQNEGRLLSLSFSLSTFLFRPNFCPSAFLSGLIEHARDFFLSRLFFDIRYVNLPPPPS